jgi:POT family proton-dependent oligopeptide transporter
VGITPNSFQIGKSSALLFRLERKRCETLPQSVSAIIAARFSEETAGGFMSLAQRLEEVRTGFERPFWVANISEIFERLAYYGAFASLANYLREALSFPTEQTGTLTGIFGGAVWFLAIFGGAIADKLGFRRALSLAYAILAGAYFLLGSIGAPWLAPVRNAVPLGLFVGFILILPALGIALVKPSVVGTTARASRENVRSLGYSIYYSMVNIGGLLGPFAGSEARRHWGQGKIFLIAAAAVFAMFFFVLAFFREPRKVEDQPVPTMGETLRNFRMVLGNPKFMLFLLIFSGYWVVFWQQWIAMPVYLHQYVNQDIDVERILMTDSIIVIACTIALNYLTRKLPAFTTIILGTFITGISWLILAFRPSLWGAVGTIAVLAIGEIVHQPRYYEYVSRLAPAGQQGTYLGFAFLPLGIGSLVGGWLGGKALHHFGEVMNRPQWTWFAISGVGVLTTVLLLVYDRLVEPSSPGERNA